MEMGQSAPVGRTEDRGQDKVARDGAAKPAPAPAAQPPARGAQFSDWAAI